MRKSITPIVLNPMTRNFLKGRNVKNSPHGFPLRIIGNTNSKNSRSEQALSISVVIFILLQLFTSTEH